MKNNVLTGLRSKEDKLCSWVGKGKSSGFLKKGLNACKCMRRVSVNIIHVGCLLDNSPLSLFEN